MHKEEIKARIRMEFGSLEAFERAKALPHESVSDALRGRGVSRTEDEIAKFIGLPAKKLFPGRRRHRGLDAANDKSGNPDTHRLTAVGR